jgi:hypothetical protein
MNTIAFFSYARHDDKAVNGLLSKIRKKLEVEVQAYAGDDDLEVFQDTDDIEPGDEWEQKLRDAIDGSAFFIPVLTPFYFSRPHCRSELDTWLTNYRSPGEIRRIIPIKFLPLGKLEVNANGKPIDKLRAEIDTLQYLDFTAFRNNIGLRGKLSREISSLAQRIVECREGLTGKMRI